MLSPVNVLLVAVRQSGIGEEWLRWESAKVQEVVSGERRGRSRIKMRQGSKVRHLVDLWIRNFLLTFKTQSELLLIHECPCHDL